jgi:predicted  nucleic acid-binding Zn-ribbon protein
MISQSFIPSLCVPVSVNNKNGHTHAHSHVHTITDNYTHNARAHAQSHCSNSDLIGQKRKRSDDDTVLSPSKKSDPATLATTTITATTTTTTTTNQLEQLRSIVHNHRLQRHQPRLLSNQKLSTTSPTTLLLRHQDASSSDSISKNININNNKYNIRNIDNSNYNYNDEQPCHIDCVPKEIFFKIISFIGPSSPTLITLTQLNTRYRKIMKEVCDAMLVRAKSSYRILLPQIYRNESLMSLCTRHVRCCQDIMEKCNILKSILEKDFLRGCLIEAFARGSISIPTVSTVGKTRDDGTSPSRSDTNEIADTGASAGTTENSTHDDVGKSNNSPKAPVTSNDIDKALEITLELLGADNVSYFLSNKNPAQQLQNLPSTDVLHPTFLTNGRTNIIQYFSEKIENQILSLCGKCGGKIFKYVKMMSLLQSQGMNLAPMASNTIHRWKDEERLDRARLVMQLVVHRFLVMERSDPGSASAAVVDSVTESTSEVMDPSTNEGSVPHSVGAIGNNDDNSNGNSGEGRGKGGVDNRHPFYSWL